MECWIGNGDPLRCNAWAKPRRCSYIYIYTYMLCIHICRYVVLDYFPRYIEIMFQWILWNPAPRWWSVSGWMPQFTQPTFWGYLEYRVQSSLSNKELWTVHGKKPHRSWLRVWNWVRFYQYLILQYSSIFGDSSCELQRCRINWVACRDCETIKKMWLGELFRYGSTLVSKHGNALPAYKWLVNLCSQIKLALWSKLSQLSLSGNMRIVCSVILTVLLAKVPLFGIYTHCQTPGSSRF